MAMTNKLAETRNAMLNRLVADLPPEIRQWRALHAVRDDCAAMLDEQLDWCTNESFAKLRAQRIGIGSPHDYLQRIIDIGGGRVLCGIRFYNLDPHRPFVELIAWSDSAIDIAAAARAAIDAHQVFQPRSVRIFSAGVSPPALAGKWRVELDDALCASPVGSMLTAPAAQLHRVTLADAHVNEALTFVEQSYAAFAERAPTVARCVEPADRDELAECRASGRLAWWLVDGVRAGLIAVCPDQMLGLDGYQVVEEVVGAAHAGFGTAAAAQQRLAESLAEHTPDCVLFGTIDAHNTPSRRTAVRAGRREIAAWWSITSH